MRGSPSLWRLSMPRAGIDCRMSDEQRPVDCLLGVEYLARDIRHVGDHAVYTPAREPPHVFGLVDSPRADAHAEFVGALDGRAESGPAKRGPLRMPPGVTAFVDDLEREQRV